MDFFTTQAEIITAIEDAARYILENDNRRKPWYNIGVYSVSQYKPEISP